MVYDKVHAGLEALRIQAEQYGSFLIPVVMAKLTQDVRLQNARLTTKEVWEIDELLQVLRTEVEAREVSKGVRVHNTRHLQETSHTNKWDKRTASAMLTQDAGQNPSCIYCRDSHYSASCGKVTTVQSRRF